MTKAKKTPSKLCLRCNKVKPIIEFYKNESWEEQNYHDLYCKDCARTVCINQNSIRKYFWENNRVWRDSLWEAGKKKAEKSMTVNPDYINPRTSENEKVRLLDEETAHQCLLLMNYPTYYTYSENSHLDKPLLEFDADTNMGKELEDENGNKIVEDSVKVYSVKWDGMYTNAELQWLDNYYEGLDEAYVLDNINIQDYAKKVARASLEVDKRYNRLLSGIGSMKEYQDAMEVFDKISKSANFAACQRKGPINNGMGSLSEIIWQIEFEHRDQYEPVTFPPDDVDKIIADFAHTDVAIQ